MGDVTSGALTALALLVPVVAAALVLAVAVGTWSAGRRMRRAVQRRRSTA